MFKIIKENDDKSSTISDKLLSELKSFGFKQFTKNEWYGYAGCEKFEDDSEPLVSNGVVDNENFYSNIIIDSMVIGIEILVPEGSVARYNEIEFKDYEGIQLLYEFPDRNYAEDYPEDIIDLTEEIYNYIKQNSDKSFEDIINDLEDKFSLEVTY